MTKDQYVVKLARSINGKIHNGENIGKLWKQAARTKKIDEENNFWDAVAEFGPATLSAVVIILRSGKYFDEFNHQVSEKDALKRMNATRG